jgi:NADP-dependent 3-hydroxy acid dehydrogenase YdfG
MKNIIVITGASSGLGALAARALAIAGQPACVRPQAATPRRVSGADSAGHSWELVIC